MDDEAWIAVSSTRDLPPLDHLHPLLLREELDQLRGIILGNLNAFAKDKLDIGCTNIVEHSIELVEGAEPHKEVLRRLNPEKQRQTDEQVADLLHLGVTEPARSPWGSGIVMAKKKDPKVLRMCIDFRNLNAVTIKDAHPLPRFDATIISLGGARFFTTLDFGSASWQIVMKLSDEPKITFATKGGLYQWTRMRFALYNATASFQRLMNIVLKGIPQEPGNMVLCYVDDILIVTTAVEQHLEKLDQVFARIAAAGIKFKNSKCNLLHTNATFLGRIIGEGEVKPNPEMYARLEKWEPPKTKKHLRSFLGFVNFVQGLSEMPYPLKEMTKPNREFKWEDQHTECFEKVKSALLQAPPVASTGRRGRNHPGHRCLRSSDSRHPLSEENDRSQGMPHSVW